MAIGKAVQAALAAMLLIAAGAGCRRPAYRILTDLPDPPGSLGLREGPATRPADDDDGEALTALSPAPVPPPPRPDPAVWPWTPDVREVPWRHVVIHHSATDTGSAASFDRMHRLVNRWDELGYHFVICNGRGNTDGTIEVGSRWFKQKWGAHCGRTPNNEYNEFGIGICLVGDFSRQMPTERQLASLRRLVLDLAERYDIPAERVIGHRQAPGSATDCPGDRLEAFILQTLRKEMGR